MNNQIIINTSNNVDITYKPAGIGKRIGAYLIDFIIKISMVLLVVFIITASSIENVLGSSSFYILIFFLAIPIVFYTLLFEIYMNGQTPGKKALDIKVISLDGRPPSMGQYILRWLFLIVDVQLLSGIVAIISISASDKGQRIGDIVAGTTVIDLQNRKREFHEMNIDADYIPQYEEAQQLSPDEVQIIQNTLHNRSTNNFELIKKLATKVEQKLYISREGSSRAFLTRIIKDYEYYILQKSRFDIDDEDDYGDLN